MYKLGMKRRHIAAAATLLLMALAPTASAHVQFDRDPDDVRGHLDIEKITFEDEVTSWVFTLKTHDGWAPKAIGGVNGGINIYLDTAGDDRLNYYIVIAKDRRNVACTLYNRKGEQKGEGEARKTSGTTVTCEVRSGLIRREGRNIKWAFQTSWKLSKDNYEYDYAPNEGYRKHRV